MIDLRLIGDIHGKYDHYLNLVKDCQYTLQVGDLGFDYEPIFHLDPEKHRFIGGNHDNYTLKYRPDLDLSDVKGDSNLTILGSGYHNFAEIHPGYSSFELFKHPEHPGNCGVYEFVKMPPNSLGNYGIWSIFDIDIFFVRGAWSIDGKYRRVDSTWYPREQISSHEATCAIELYEKVKPDIMVTHCVPTSHLKNLILPISNGNSIRTQTGALFDEMLKVHRPKLWYFGHYHQHNIYKEDGTTFICINQCPNEGCYIDVEIDSWRF